MRSKDPEDSVEEEPRWPAVAAALAVLGLYFALSPVLTPGPRWIFPVLVTSLLASLVITRQMRLPKVNYILGSITALVLTLFMLVSIYLLLRALPAKVERPGALLRSAGALWLSNIFVFAQWYWRLDAGGPWHRDRRRGQGVGHTDGAFLFPQMGLSRELRELTGEMDWSPNFWDYLYLAFSTSTAFSATDTAPLSRWAKILMMIQASISLVVLSLLAARAINIL